MYILTLLIIIAVFALSLTLSTLNYMSRTKPIPECVADVYDREKYNTWLKYTMEIFKFSTLVKAINTILLILFFLLGFFPVLAKFTDNLTSSPLIKNILFLGLYFAIGYVFNLGFDIYRTFSIEARYGFNKTSLKTFILDQIKSIILMIVLGGPLLYLTLFLYEKLGNESLIYTWLIFISLILIINILYTKLFVRIFNKITPLEEGELYNKAKLLAKNTGYELKKISILDASRRSSRLNAYFTGFGKFKQIMLYDTLLEKCTPDEIVSVLAHEIGHAKHKDVLVNFLISIFSIGGYLVLLSFFLSSPNLAVSFGFEEIHLGFSLLLFEVLMEPISILLAVPLTALSRKAEYKADAFAAQSGFQKDMIRALKVLARENFSNLTPHPLMVKLTYSHPPVNQRIEALNKL